AEAAYWLLSKQEAYREPQSSAVSSTGDKRDFAMSSRKLEFLLRHPPKSSPCRTDGEDMAPTKRPDATGATAVCAGRFPPRRGPPGDDALRAGSTTHEREGGRY